MGVLYDYFVATDDAEAAATVDWVGGPSCPPEPKGLRRRRKVEPLPTVDLKGIDPIVMMATLEGLLTGRDVDEVLDGNIGRDVAERDGGERMVVRLSDELFDALALADARRLREVAGPWSQTEELVGSDPGELAEVLDGLADLARQGRAAGRRMYCWVCV